MDNDVPVTVKEGGKVREIILSAGKNLVHELEKNGVKIAAACEGNLGCGTCLCNLDERTFDLIDPATDKEEDLLVFSPGLQKTSRLACGITVDRRMKDAYITVPEMNRNFVNEEDE